MKIQHDFSAKLQHFGIEAKAKKICGSSYCRIIKDNLKEQKI
jgi:hypothetical protein